MTHPARTKTFRCATCSKDTFETTAALSQHQNTLGHFLVWPQGHAPFADLIELNSYTTAYVSDQKCEASNQAMVAIPGPTSASQITSIVASTALANLASQVTSTVTPTPELAGTSSTILAEDTEQLRNFVATQMNAPLAEKNPTVVPAHDYGLLYSGLLTRGHPSTRLQLHGYRLTTEPLKKPSREADKVKKQLKRELPEQATPQDERSQKVDQREERIELDFLQTPGPSTRQPNKRKAIALDREMVGIGPKGNQDALAFLSAVDFVTGEVLINSYVRPPEKVKQWRSRISGVTASKMAAAVSNR
ncbi:hypothetical protein BJX64DRAFT_290430 [Aspergillus heterothallicus]